MTRTETIRSALAGLWNSDATAYDLAWAVLKAEGLDDDDLEMEVESVITRALGVRNLVDLSKVAAEVAKLLPRAPSDTSKPEPEALPLCEAIKAEIKISPFTELKEALAATWCMEMMDRHFAALSVEEVARAIEGPQWAWTLISGRDRADRMIEAQAVMKLLRKE